MCDEMAAALEEAYAARPYHLDADGVEPETDAAFDLRADARQAALERLFLLLQRVSPREISAAEKALFETSLNGDPVYSTQFEFVVFTDAAEDDHHFSVHPW